MKERSSILIYSEFDFLLSKVMANFKKRVEADLVMISREYELENVLNSISIDLLVVNLNGSRLNQSLLKKMMKIPGIAALFLTGKDERVPEFIASKKGVFSFPIEYAAESSQLGININSILELTSHWKAIHHQAQTKADRFLMDKNLCRYIMELDQKNKTLANIKSQIDHLCSEPSRNIERGLRTLSSSIPPSSFQTKYWDDFHIYFEKVNPNFISKLTLKHPNLTTKDLKYCCYLKMNMSNNDIKNLLSINQDSVRTHKYRLKKKLGLRKDQSIRSYLQLERAEQGRISA